MSLYAPSPVPSEASELPGWLLQELHALSTILQQMQTQQVDECAVAPSKPRTGMIVLANGTTWNPGSGRGYYGYDATTAAWRFLG